MCRVELAAVIARLMFKAGLKWYRGIKERYTPPFPAVLWIVNVRKRKHKWKKKKYIWGNDQMGSSVTSFSLPTIISMLLLFEWITRFPINIYWRQKLIFFIKWIFHVSDVLNESIISRKYGLIFSRYSPTNSALF